MGVRHCDPTRQLGRQTLAVDKRPDTGLRLRLSGSDVEPPTCLTKTLRYRNFKVTLLTKSTLVSVRIAYCTYYILLMELESNMQILRT